jgi:hypothetical protein
MIRDNEEEGRAESNTKVTRRGKTILFLPLCRANVRGTARKEEKAKNESSRIACVANGVILSPLFPASGPLQACPSGVTTIGWTKGGARFRRRGKKKEGGPANISPLLRRDLPSVMLPGYKA